MLRKLQTTPVSRCLHVSATTAATAALLRGKQVQAKPRTTKPERKKKTNVEEAGVQQQQAAVSGPKRNELGVQLLSRELHGQIFRNVSFPPPPKPFVRIAQDHLKSHGLDPSQGSVLPNIGFTLPPLQGRTLDEHFYRIGATAAQPWLTLAQDLAAAQLPPKPDHWHIQAGWTRYSFMPDGSSYSEYVDYPEFEGQSEEMLVFDVETMPEYSPYAVMACAATKNAWYSWISPWLLGETDDPKQLIPLGDPTVPRVVVGHNVSYDRARILEEYSVNSTQTRFLDTMALHVAVKGISSHQRPAWMKYRKSKEKALEQRDEAIETVYELMREAEERLQNESDPERRADLERVMREMEESLPSLQAASLAAEPVEDLTEKRWEDLTSANSLADVAQLHCDITMEKETRNDFMTATPEEIRDGIHNYLDYCSTDVAVTHAVFAKVLPSFLTACPSPVSFAGVLTMGSSFLTVNEEWERYLANAERTYKELEEKVKRRLIDLAHEAKGLMESEKWKDDVWLSQLDWTPKVAGKSRGIIAPETSEPSTSEPTTSESPSSSTNTQVGPIPAWFRDVTQDPLNASVINKILPLLLQLSYDGFPLRHSPSFGWHYVVDGEVERLPTSSGKKVQSILGASHGLPALKSGRLSASDVDLAMAVSRGDRSEDTSRRVLELAKALAEKHSDAVAEDPWLQQLDWKLVEAAPSDGSIPSSPKRKSKVVAPKPPPVLWPKWYWDISKPKKDCPPGTLDLTVRNRIAPLLLHLSWQGWPLFHSREHGWTFRVPSTAEFETRATALKFEDPADAELHNMTVQGGFTFYKLPHKDGEKANVGSPLSKTFMKYAQDGTLASPFEEAKDALDMNAQCSYWISARDRVMKQMVVWQDDKADLGIARPAEPEKKWGIIVPQVITMGTVTRRAIEKTWLTASNAKKNRVGSELKAMVRAPPGYALVGADVDSEELWISSVMGDAQFGLHGATAIGWMTLEGTKAAGTDLHSKTASILGISRDQAKVFNYSRIYGAGMRHAVLLLLQSNAGMLPEQAQKLAENLYASTKGKNTHGTHLFGRKFWYGGTESFVFNKLEEIALSDKPQTPALGCGITYALSKEYLPAKFGSDYMPSRINWVVQSSGVDYLHLLIVSMEHLIAKYNIQARYLISVHDELRYLVKEEDKYRAALALQIANLWTRSYFAFKLGMDDLPQGVAFFSSVDIDHVLRKEVDMPCVTPSQPNPIPPGESLDIGKTLEKTNGGSLWPGGEPMVENDGLDCGSSLFGYSPPDCLAHRASSAAWLRAQATSDLDEIRKLAQTYKGEVAATAKRKRGGSINTGLKRLQKVRALGDGNNVDWTNTVEEFLKALQR
ncbi:gamma DNA-directed DNA polymerase [Trametes coccinea BRFM310]|uniref:DNA-directed DNA polymerase n=1 Tax=Trametes coccinea (strain BRFM310) TaxID=1353009 RepID=A0A1Y2IVC7_TRAC3|nr:gamma DNA-directed DNA polymerase [Trametes coccinea BRFM310]